MLYPVILSGGAGTRLWPWSRSDLPKQFIKLIGKKSLFQNTLNRVKNSRIFHPPYIITNQKYLKLLNEQIDITNTNILVESIARGTAPAITFAALAIHSNDQNAVMLVMPSDIHFKNNRALYSAINQCEMMAIKH